MPNTAKIPRFLGVNRKPFSSTSLAAPFASTNLFGITSVGVRGPPATAKREKTRWGAAGSSEGDRSGGSRARAHAEGAFARGNDWYAMEAPAHALLARLCERAGLRRARQCDRGEKPNRWKKAAGRSVRMGKQSPAELARGSSSADALTNLRKLRVFRARTTTSHSHILAPAMGVKLRVRVAGVPGPARALEVPEACTLAQLRQKIVAKVLVDLPGWGPGVAESDVEVSLNGDEDLGAAGHDESATLRACGVTRGDLIRVKMREGSGGDASAAGGHASAGNVSAANEPRVMPRSVESVDDSSTRAASATAMRRAAAEAAERRAGAESGVDRDGSAPVSIDDSRVDVRFAFGQESPMELGPDDEPRPRSDEPPPRGFASSGGGSDDAEEETRDGDSFLPSALRRALAAEARGSGEATAPQHDDAALLFVATHAALLETGLVLARGEDEDEARKSTRSRGFDFSLPAGWRGAASRTGAARARYALAEAPGGATCEVKAQSPDGSTLVACAGVEVATPSSAKGGDGDAGRSETPARVAVVEAGDWLRSGSEPRVGTSALVGRFATRRVRDSWSKLKDAFASRLRHDLRIANGLPSVAGLLALPDDLKVAVLRRIPLDDHQSLCAASAVCREMRFAADADALWSARFEATFGAEAARKARERERRREGTKRSNENDADAYDHALHWKRLFAEAVIAARKDALARKRARDLAERNRAEWFAPRFPRPGVPEGGVPLGPPGYTPGITGGDYDLYPGGSFGSFMPGFPGGFPGSGFPGAPTPRGGWPVMPGGMPGGVPTPTPGGGLGNGRGRGGLGPARPRVGPGWDGRPRPPGAPDGDGFGFL